MSDVNIPLLRKAVEWAEAEAAKPISEGAWYQKNFIEARTCGTTYCIAGWTLHAHGWTNEEIMGDDDVAETAAVLLGIPMWDGEADAGSHLFADNNTITDVRRIAEDLAGERL